MPQRPVRFIAALFVAALFALVSLHAQAPTDGLLAYYPLDGNAIDATGHGFDGTNVATTATTDRFGNPNGALAFDGNSSYIDCGNPKEFNFVGSFSLVVWVKLDSPQAGKYILAKYNYGVSSHAYGIGTTDSSAPYAFLSQFFGGFNDTSGGVTISPLNDGRWHCLAFVYDDPNGGFLYNDGVLVGRINIARFAAFQDSAPLMIPLCGPERIGRR